MSHSRPGRTGGVVPAALTIVIAASALSSCAADDSRLNGPDGQFAAAAAVQDPTASWKIPLADSSLALRGDGLFGDGSHSVYANGVCTVVAKIFATLAGSNTGDATIQVSAPKRNRCGRVFTLHYPDGFEETLASFSNLTQLQNATSSIPAGTTVRRRLLINPGALAVNPSRCGRLVFGANGAVGLGSDSVLVTRLDGRTWRVSSPPAPNNSALCEANGLLYAMPLDFLIVASRDLP